MNSQGEKSLSTAMTMILLVIVLLFIIAVPLYRSINGYNNDLECESAGGRCLAGCIGETYLQPGFTCPDNRKCCFNQRDQDDVQQGGTAIPEHTVAVLSNPEHETVLQEAQPIIKTDESYEFYGYATGDKVGVCVISIFKQNPDEERRVIESSRVWMSRDVCISPDLLDQKKTSIEVVDNDYEEGTRYFLQFIAFDKSLGTDPNHADWQPGGSSRVVAFSDNNWVSSYSKELHVEAKTCEDFTGTECSSQTDCVLCPETDANKCLSSSSEDGKIAQCIYNCGSAREYVSVENNICSKTIPEDNGNE